MKAILQQCKGEEEGVRHGGSSPKEANEEQRMKKHPYEGGNGESEKRAQRIFHVPVCVYGLVSE